MIILGIASPDANVLRWAKTARACFDGRIILFLTGYQEVPDVETRYIQESDDFWKKTDTFLCKQWKYIAEICREFPDEYILRTDVWDVIFQDNPLKYIDPQVNKIYISLEGISNEENNFQMAWFKNSPFFSDICKKTNILHKSVINSGTICAKGHDLLPIALDVYHNKFQTGLDQTELNLIANENPERFTVKNNFLMSVNLMFKKTGCIFNHQICSVTGVPWCVVHENSNPKYILNQLPCGRN